MMHIKFIGGILVLLSSSLLGMSFSNDVRKRIELMLEFKNLLYIVRSGMEYNRFVLPEIFEGSSGIVKGEASRLARLTADGLMQDEKREFFEIWTDVVAEVYGKTSVGKDLDIFLEAGRVMGILDMKLRISGIDSCIDTLEEKIRSEQVQMPEKCRIRRNLGLLSGLFIIIVLI